MRKIFKQSLILILSILSGSHLYPQETSLFPDNLKWTGRQNYEFYHDRIDYYVTRGDTIIDNIRRNKLYYRIDGKDSKEELCAFFHLEDKKVITRMYSHSSFFSCIGEDPDQDKDIVLYDFDLALGDSVPGYHCNFDEYLKVQAIDSVYIGDAYKKIYDIRSDTWIEGIGSIRELFAPIAAVPTGDPSRRLVCVSLNDDLLYFNSNLIPGFEECPEITDEQFSIDIGRDLTFCADRISTGSYPFLPHLSLRGDFFGSLIFSWSGLIKDQDGRVYPASHFLNDTIQREPQLIASWGNNIWNQFILEVKDNETGWIARDSIRIRFSQYDGVLTETNPIVINPGDSTLFDASVIDIGGIRPYVSYEWTPTDGLSHPDSSITWCKPEVSKEYICTVTDSSGCRNPAGSISRKIVVDNASIFPVSEEKAIYQSEETVYFENPENSEVTISFYDLSGKIIHRGQTKGNSYRPDGQFIPGIYLCKVKYERMEKSLKYIVK